MTKCTGINDTGYWGNQFIRRMIVTVDGVENSIEIERRLIDLSFAPGLFLRKEIERVLKSMNVENIDEMLDRGPC